MAHRDAHIKARRAHEPACQCELVMPSKIFFARSELLTGVLKGVARNQRRIHALSEDVKGHKVGSKLALT